MPQNAVSHLGLFCLLRGCQVKEKNWNVTNPDALDTVLQYPPPLLTQYDLDYDFAQENIDCTIPILTIASYTTQALDFTQQFQIFRRKSSYFSRKVDNYDY